MSIVSNNFDEATPHEAIVHGYDVLDLEQRASNVPPEISVEGHAIRLSQDADGGTSYEFLERLVEPSEVLDPVSFLGSGELIGTIPPDSFARAIDRLLNSGTIFYKTLDPDMRERVDMVARIPGFRREIRELMAWLIEPDETLRRHVERKAQIVSEFEISQSAPELLGKLTNDQLTEVFSEAGIFETDVSFEEYMRSFLSQYPQAVKSLQGNVLKDPEKLWRRFNSLGASRRAQVIEAAMLSLPLTVQIQMAPSIATRLFTEQFDIWYPSSSDEGVSVKERRRTPRPGGLDTMMGYMANPKMQIIKRHKSDRGYRKQIGEQCDVLLTEHVRRRELKAVVSNSVERLKMEPDIFASRLVGFVLLSLLFRQENLDMTDADRDMLARIRNPNTNEQAARRAAFALVQATYNARVMQLELEMRTPDAIERSQN